MEPRKERYSIRKLSVGAASVLIGLTFISMGNSHSVSAASQNPEVVATKTTQVMNEQKLSKAPSAAATETTAKNTLIPSTKTENNKNVSVKATQASTSTSQSTQKQTLIVPKKLSQMTPISKAAISDQKTQDTTIKSVDLSGTLSEMNSNINLKHGTTFNISGNFSNNGFEVNSVTDNQGNHINYSDKDGKLALDFSKSINLMYNSNQNNHYQIPTFKDLDIDLSNLKPSDLTTKNNITTLNDNYDLTSKCTYNDTNTIAPMYQSVGKIISVDENNNQLLYPFTRVYNTSNVNNDTGNFKTILSADDIGNLNTPLTVTLPKISGYSAVNDAGTPIASITVNNILKNTVVKYKKNNPTEAGNLNIYPITDMSTTPSVMTPIESIPLNQNITINFDPTFVTNLNKKLPLDDQNARYNIIIDQTGKHISSIDLNTITDKSKDINLFLVRNAIDPQTIQVSAGKSKGVDINSENNYELFNENGKFVAYNVKDTLADSDQNHVVDDIDMSISNGSEVLYPTGITSIPNSGDADFTNMMGTFNPNTGKYNPITIQAYSQNGSRVIGKWQLQLGDSTYDGGYKNIIHVTFTSTDKTYQGPVQPIYIEGSSDGGPNPMIATVNVTVTLQDASVKFIDLNKAHPQNLAKYDETAQGAVDNQISFKIPVEDQIKKLEDLGYSLVSDNFDNGNKYYNEDNTKNQFVVYVNHKLGITPENVSVKRMINYQGILPNGKIIAVNGSPQGTITDMQTANFTRNAVVDKVFNQIIGYDTNSDLHLPEVTVKDGDRAWSSMTHTLPEVDSQVPDKVKGPDGKAFTSVDVPVVSAVTVSPNSKDITVLVTYKREIGKANLLIVDEDNDMKQIELPGIQTSFDSEGNVGTPINFDGTDTSVTNLEKDGYVYDSTNFKAGTKFDNLNDDKGDSQQYLIVMKHGQVPATPENPHNVDPNELTKHYTSTVYYQTHDGKTVAPTSSQTSTWTRHLTVDAINGDIIKNGIYDTPWTANKPYYDKFNLPSVTDYTVESVTKNGIHITTFVPGQKVIQQNLADTVYYDSIPVIEQGSIRVIVHDVQTNQDLSDYGKYSNVENVGTRFAYNTAAVISELTKAGYRVLNPQIVIPAEISKGDHQFVIYVDHQVIPVTPKHPGNGLTADNLQRLVTETVNYRVGGNQSLAASAHLATLNFTGKAYYDSVTKKWTDASGKELANQTENITWTATNGHDFDTVVSPLISGYRVINISGNYNDGEGNVKEITAINQNSENIAVVVIYAKIPVVPTKSVQNAQLIIRDVTPGQEKELGSFSQSGYEGDPISFKNACELVQDLLGKDYAWESASYNSEPLNAKNYDEIAFGKYDNLSDKQDPTQKWIINLIHRATPVSMKQTVTRDVTYVNEQGHEMPDLSPVHQEFTFTGKTTTDDVTGSKKTSWSVSTHKFDETKPIDTSKYKVINVREVNTSVKVNMENGVVASQQITPTSQDRQVIITLAKKAVIPTSVENGTVVVNYIDQTEGKVLETEPLTGKTDTQVDYSPTLTIKNYMDKGYILEKDDYPTQDVRYPDGNKVYEIDFVHGTTTKTSSITGTQTVRYQGAGNLTQKSNVSMVKFEDSVTYDKVTGKIIKVTGWTSPQTYKIVVSPTVQGYIPDKIKVGGDTVSVDKNGKGNIDRNYLVVYTKNTTPTPHPDNHQPTSPGMPKQTPQQPQTPQTPSQKQNTSNPNPTPQNNEPTTPQTSTNSTPSKKPTPKKPVNGKKYTPVSHKTSTIKENKKLIATKLKRVNANKVEFSHLVQKMKPDTNENSASTSKSIKEKGEMVTVKSKKVLATPKQLANKKLKNQRELPPTGGKNDTLARNIGLAILATSSVILSSLLGVRCKRRR